VLQWSARIFLRWAPTPAVWQDCPKAECACSGPARPGAADVWIDFSSPGAALANASAAAQAGAAIVIGTTGLSTQDKDAIALAAKKVPIVLAPNMSVGVNVMLRLVADAARLLGAGYDVEIVETHHRAKRDAPSGTALRLAEAVAEATGRDLGKSARYQRHGDIGPRTGRRDRNPDLGGGDVVGHNRFSRRPMGESSMRIASRATRVSPTRCPPRKVWMPISSAVRGPMSPCRW